MKKLVIISIFLLSIIACTNRSETFDYTIKGRVVGKDSGKICFAGQGRTEDEIVIPYEDGTFEYKGSSKVLYYSFLSFCEDDEEKLFIIAVEPGEIIVELNRESVFTKSRITKGENSIALFEAIQPYYKYAEEAMGSLMDEDLDEEWWEEKTEGLFASLKQNLNYNYGGIFILNEIGREYPILEMDEVGFFLEEIKDPILKQSREYRELYSYWMANNDSINAMDQRAANFMLEDISGTQQEFTKLSDDKITLVELSDPTCGNLCQNTKSFLPVYEAYHEKGFEIITIVCESDYNRWAQWVEDENLPWVSLIEMEDDYSSPILYSELLFQGGNYLVDKNGIIIAKGLSADGLEAMLIEELD